VLGIDMEITLTFIDTPEIEVPKRRVHGGVGYKAQLTCLVHADPPAEVQWARNISIILSTQNNHFCRKHIEHV